MDKYHKESLEGDVIGHWKRAHGIQPCLGRIEKIIINKNCKKKLQEKIAKNDPVLCYGASVERKRIFEKLRCLAQV